MIKSFKTKTILIAFSLLFFPSLVFGKEVVFNIDRSYDLTGRQEITAVLQRTTNQIYFYVDKGWWESLDSVKKQNLDSQIYNLSVEFERKIYPTLTSAFGFEAEKGINEDERITVLIHPIISSAGGYFNSGDIYSKFEYPKSNERKMIYLNSRYIENPEAKSFLAHEFMHLITINQKELLRNVTEEIWLNEARSEYAPTLLGYDDVYRGSNLESRVKDFLKNPQTSLPQWLNRLEDYGAVNLFSQYLVDHYGKEILIDSLQSNKVGIESINYALEKNNYDEDFTQIFKDWAITLLVNDCKTGEKYCYLNENLKDLRITPTFYHLSKIESVFSTYHSATYWELNWHRFLGGGKYLFLEFNGNSLVDFEVSYLLCQTDNNCSLEFISLDEEQKGEISLSDFNEKYSSLTIIPFIKNKVSGFNGQENSFSFSWTVTIKEKNSQETETELINQLLAQIEELKMQIAEYKVKIQAILAEKGSSENSFFCQRLDNNLYFGLTNNPEVTCLQEFLKAQGSDIYPEGLVTGNFLSLTQAAVIRFQERHSEEILLPLNLQQGTGYVGSATRAKINSLINQ